MATIQAGDPGTNAYDENIPSGLGASDFADLGAKPSEAPAAPLAGADAFADLGAKPSSDFSDLGAKPVSRQEHIASLVNDPDFDPAMHAALNKDVPGEQDLAYEVRQAKKALPIGQKLSQAFSNPGATASGVASGIGNFFKGLFYQVPKDTLQHLAYSGAFDDDPTGLGPRLGIHWADPQKALTKQAEATLIAQHGEEGLTNAYNAVTHALTPSHLGGDPTSQDLTENSPEAIRAAEDKIEREYFDRQVQAAQNQIQLAQGRPIDTGAVAGIYGAAGQTPSNFVSPEALKGAGAPEVDQSAIASDAAAADPMMLALSGAPMLPGAKLIGGKIAQGVGKVMQLPMDALEHIPGKMGATARAGTAGGAVVGLGELAIHNPALAAKIGVGTAVAKGTQMLGRVIEQQGKEAATDIPSELSQRASEGMLDSARGVGSRDISAELGRAVGNAPANAITTAVGMAPLNVAMSDGDPKKLVESEASAGAFGAALGALHSARPMLVEALRPRLRYDGAASLAQAPNQDLAQKTHDFLDTVSEDTRNRAYEMMGALQGLATQGADGKEGTSQFAILSKSDYDAEVAKLGAAANDGGRGFFVDGNGTAIIDGSYGDDTDTAHTIGHEGAHMAGAILRAAGAKGTGVWNSMMDQVSAGLIKDGKPTPEFKGFIDDYNHAFDPSGKTQRLNPSDPEALEEFLAEHAGRISAMEGAAGFALPKGLTDKLRENVSRYTLGALGLDADKIGHQTSYLNARELGSATRAMRDTFAQIAHMPRQEPREALDQPSAPPTAGTDQAPLATPPGSTATPPVEPPAAVEPATAPPIAPAPTPAPPVAPVANPATPAPVAPPVAGSSTPEPALENLKISAPATPPGALETNAQKENEGASTGVATLPPEQRTPNSAPPRPPKPPEVLPEHIDAALEEAKTKAEERAAKARGGAKVSKEERVAQIAHEERVKSLTDLLHPDAEGLHPEKDPDTGETTSVRGDIDPSNPLHAAILKEFGYTPEHIQNILDLQEKRGRGVWLRDYNHAEQEGHETGSGLDFSAQQRSKEYEASPTSPELGQREGSVTKADKPFTPYSTVLTSSGVNVRGFDQDKFLSNVDEVVKAAEAAKIKTGLEGVTGKERDAKLADAFRKVSQNHAHGWKGDGSSMLKVFPDSGIKPDMDYAGQPVDSDLANVINMAMAKRGARPPNEPKGKTPTEGAKKRFAEASAKSKEALGIARLNKGFINPDTGEVNELRQKLGETVADRLKPVVSNMRPDLIEGGVHDEPGTGKSVHAHGFNIKPSELTEFGTPHEKPTTAGFMPKEDLASIKSKIEDDGIEPEKPSDMPKFQSLTPFWMAPDGTMYDGHGAGGRHHYTFAEKYIVPGTGDPMEAAKAAGWHRVNVSPSDGEIMTEGAKLTKQQRISLEDLAYSQELGVVDDDGSRIIDNPNPDIPSQFMPKSEQGALEGISSSIKSKMKDDGALADYRGEHEAPDRENGAPLHNLSGMYPDDFYSSEGSKLYGHDELGSGSNARDHALISGLRNRPNAQVKVYRAVPHEPSTKEQISKLEDAMKAYQRRGRVPSGENPKTYYDDLAKRIEDLKAAPAVEESRKGIKPGDWVTASREYAKAHGEDNLNGKYKIASKTVPAKHLFTDGNSLQEFGYDPRGPKQDGGALAKFMPGNTPTSVEELKKETERPEFKRWAGDAAVVLNATPPPKPPSYGEDAIRRGTVSSKDIERIIKHDEDTIAAYKHEIESAPHEWEAYKKIAKDPLNPTSEEIKASMNAGIIPMHLGMDQAISGKKAYMEQVQERLEKLKASLQQTKDAEAKLDEEYGVNAMQTGKPIVVRAFHATPRGEFHEFDSSKRGATTKAGSATLGDFFSGSYDTAKSYHGEQDAVIPHVGFSDLKGVEQRRLIDDIKHHLSREDELDELRGENPEMARALDHEWKYSYEAAKVHEADWQDPEVRDFAKRYNDLKLQSKQDTSDEGIRKFAENNPEAVRDMAEDMSGREYDTSRASNFTHEVFVRMKNPYVHDYDGEHYREESYYDVIRKAKAAGHDGVILKNTYDGGDKDNIFVTFDTAGNVKNPSSGFDESKADVRFLPKDKEEDRGALSGAEFMPRALKGFNGLYETDPDKFTDDVKERARKNYEERNASLIEKGQAEKWEDHPRSYKAEEMRWALRGIKEDEKADKKIAARKKQGSNRDVIQELKDEGLIQGPEDTDLNPKSQAYFALGHDDPNGKNWIYRRTSGEIEAKTGGTHGRNFGHDIADRTFKGWYDPSRDITSVVFPESERSKLDHEPTVDDIPQAVYSKLRSKFGKSSAMIAFMPKGDQDSSSIKSKSKSALEDFDPNEDKAKFMPADGDKAKYKIVNWHEDMDEDQSTGESTGLDPWEIADKAEKVFRSAGLRPMSDKDTGLVALGKDGEPIGATYHKLTEEPASDFGGGEDDEPVKVYEFDIGVDPKKQGGTVGYMLTKKSIDEARSQGADVMKNWVINPKMADMLERFFGFEHESEPSDTKEGYSAHMVKWLKGPDSGRKDLPKFMPGEDRERSLDTILRQDFGTTWGEATQAQKEKAIAKKKSEARNLLAIHNVTADKLEKAMQLGGLAVPSIGIVKKDSPHLGFGEISLIGNRTMIDPQERTGNRVYDRDIYSMRHPQATHEVNKRAVAALYKEFEKANPNWWATGAMDAPYEITRWAQKGMAGNKQSMIDNAWRSDLFRMRFTEYATGKKFEAKKIPQPLNSELSDTEAFRKFANSGVEMGSDFYSMKPGDPRYDAFRKAIEDAWDEKYAGKTFRGKKVEFPVDSYFHEDGTPNISADRIANDALLIRNPRMVYDRTTNREVARNYADEHQDEYLDWVKKKIEPLFGSATVKTFEGRVPYTIDNVVSAMIKKNPRAQENVTSGLGIAAARGSREFKTVDEIRQAQDQLTDKKGFAEAKEEADKSFYAAAQLVNDAHVTKSKFGQLDDASGAIGTYLAGKTKTDAAMRSALRKNYFTGDLSDEGVKAMREAAEDIRKLPTEYFEAKLHRAVKIPEFSGAAIPSSMEKSNPDLVERLRHQVGDVETYDGGDEEDRKRAINAVAARQKAAFMPTGDESVKLGGKEIKTGDPAEFDFLRGRASATGYMGIPDKDSPFDRGYEPSGRYMVEKPNNEEPIDQKRHETGSVKFENPLVIDAGNYGTPSSWKRVLSAQFDGKTGKALSKAVIAAGYDGIVTREKDSKGGYFPGEIVDLTTFDSRKAKYMPAGDTDSPQFKKWFGDSKVVDSDGKPITVYHNHEGEEQFHEFDKSKVKSRFPYSFGFHFTTNPKEAAAYGSTSVPAFVKIENPLIINTKHPAASMEADNNRAWIQKQRYEAIKAGHPYDGVIIKAEHGDPEYDHWNVIAFEPNQIKSATENNGDFDPSNPDIRFMPKSSSIKSKMPTKEDIEALMRETEAAYQSGNHKKAEDLDAKLETALHSMEMDQEDAESDHSDDEMDNGGESMEESLASIWSRREGDGGDEEEKRLAESLKGAAIQAGWRPTKGKRGPTDEQWLAAGKAAYDSERARRTAKPEGALSKTSFIRDGKKITHFRDETGQFASPAALSRLSIESKRKDPAALEDLDISGASQ